MLPIGHVWSSDLKAQEVQSRQANECYDVYTTTLRTDLACLLLAAVRPTY